MALVAGLNEHRLERPRARGVMVAAAVHVALALAWWASPAWRAARSLVSPASVLSVAVLAESQPPAPPLVELAPKRVLEPKPNLVSVPEVPRPEVDVVQPAPTVAVQVVAAEKPQAPPAAALAKAPDAVERRVEDRPAEPKPMSISQVSYLTPPVMSYPPAARRAQEQGRVDVRVLVDAEGLPQSMSVVKSSGYVRLDEAALATVRATRFKPYRENGVARAFWVVMPLIFELDG